MKILCKTNYFKKDNLRRGKLTFDGLEEYRWGASGTGIKLYYVYDTKLHINFAKLQDAEDWKYLEEQTYTHIKNLFVDLFEDIKRQIDNNPGFDHYDVIVDIYGPGTRSVQFTTTIVITPLDDPSTRVDDALKVGISGKLGDYKFWVDRRVLNPDSNLMKRTIVPKIVNQLAEGYSNLSD